MTDEARWAIECPAADRRQAAAKGHDPVNHPAHYTSGPACPGCGRVIECIDISERMNFCKGNAFKYLWREELKGSGLVDLKKARWYLDREIARREAAHD
jgi:hypothetical protein